MKFLVEDRHKEEIFVSAAVRKFPLLLLFTVLIKWQIDHIKQTDLI
jgi:hypothetical protein